MSSSKVEITGNNSLLLVEKGVINSIDVEHKGDVDIDMDNFYVQSIDDKKVALLISAKFIGFSRWTIKWLQLILR